MSQHNHHPSQATYDLPDCHIRIKLNGSRRKLNLFNYGMGYLDPDFPYAPASLRRNSAKEGNPTQCPKCQGWVWVRPLLGPAEMTRLAFQIALSERLGGYLKLRIQTYLTEEKCEEQARKPLLALPPAQPDEPSEGEVVSQALSTVR